MRKLLTIVLIIISPSIFFGQESHEIDTSEVYFFVDIMPTTLDRTEIGIAFRNLAIREFTYPDSITCLISTVHFEFVISYKGEIINKNISFPNEHSDCTSDYDKIRNAGLELLDKMPECKPGKYNGKLVNVKYTFPLRISLQ